MESQNARKPTHAPGYWKEFPSTIRIDQGSEFVSRELDLWAYRRGVHHIIVVGGSSVAILPENCR
jgi:transposase InsO family protein